ncbi:gag-pol polyprotein [Trifolium medium]|uniref:Gag-pol polyprotein n=1 Tax=Trifolium medium TaxID=97028 RepID=A0A392MHY1_9FABA|nr:gag-pol polyprotein [Trifolium medium]
MNAKEEVLMKGIRTKDNCYLWVPQKSEISSTCLMSKEDDVELLHQKLGHLHLRGMKRAIFAEAVRGLPEFNTEEGTICGEQTKMSRPKIQHLSTTRVLELFHMDLMEPMQVENIGGKRVTLRRGTACTLYELWKGKKPNVSYFHVFGSK